MEQKRVEQLFAWLIHQVKEPYQEEVNMAMDCFLEESYTQEELERFLEYVLDRVLPMKYDQAFDYVQQQLLKG